MKQEYFTSFEEAVMDIFRENAIPVEAIAPLHGKRNTLQVVAAMGISGDLRGNLIFGCDLESARAIVDSLFRSSEIVPKEKSFGDLQKATIGEFSNQITGRALMHLARRSVDCMMTPPTVFTGVWVRPDLCSSETQYSSLVSGDFGRAEIHIGIKDAKKL